METYESRLENIVPELQFGETSLDSYYGTVFDRIDALEDEIHAFVEESVTRGQTARQLAHLKARWAHEQFPPPLYGVPVGIKDVFHVNGYQTRAGSSLPPELLVGPESAVVEILRNQGAIVIGKTVTTEFTHLPTGETRNPHELSHTPGGSSSGSAAAVAAGLCPLSLGSETTGSVVRPAAFCGVVGFRPSRNRIPTDGMVSLAPTTDHVGFFTQDFAGVRRVAPLLCRNWTPTDQTTSQSTIGVPDGAYLDQASRSGRDRFERQIAALGSAGFEVKRVPFFEDVAAINNAHEALLAAEAADAHAVWYSQHPDAYSEEMRSLLERGQTVTVDEQGKAKRSMHRTRDRIESAFRTESLDLIVAPPAPGVAPRGLDDDGDPVMNRPWAHAGVPALTLPTGATDAGLPVGIACIGRFGRDESLLTHSRALDSVIGEVPG
jgi:Asp-tRNA(Asn)/Glu-tRNA(Gln) amidotransferase A subunit family amidase